jgi:hypothetical protein
MQTQVGSRAIGMAVIFRAEPPLWFSPILSKF